MYALMIFAGWFLGQLFHRQKNGFVQNKILLSLSIFFILSLLIATLLTNVKSIGFFGDSQRQLGFFTYLGFVIYMLFAANFFNSYAVNKFIITISVLASTYIVYATLQYTGHDFIIWINQYNPIIGTLGNPNFAAAFMAIIGVLTFSFAFNPDLSKKFRLIQFIMSMSLLWIIFLSDARQGLISYGAGLAVMINILVVNKAKLLGYVYGIFTFLLSMFVVLGILQIGPFQRYLYKDSVSLRGYYWRAGIKMFKENILTGIGVDSYGSNFKYYRDPSYALKYGYELNSTNAHNVYIQHFATGGIFVGVGFILIILYITYMGLKGIKLLSDGKRIFLSGLFSGWIAYLAQGLVSIDNIGLTVWGWIIGGLIVAFVLDNTSSEKITNPSLNKAFRSSAKISSQLVLLSSIFAMIALVLVLNLGKTEYRIVSIRNIVNSQNQPSPNSFKDMVNKLSLDPLAQPVYRLEVADYLIRSGFAYEGIDLISKLSANDPMNPNYYFALAATYENLSQFENAIKQREELFKVDPYNVKNYFQLFLLYREVGDFEMSLKMKERILNFAPNSEQAKLLLTESSN